MKKFLLIFFSLIFIAFSIALIIYLNLPSGSELKALSQSTSGLPKVSSALSQGETFDLKNTFIDLLCLIILLPIGVYFVNYLKNFYGVNKDDQ